MPAFAGVWIFLLAGAALVFSVTVDSAYREVYAAADDWGYTGYFTDQDSTSLSGYWSSSAGISLRDLASGGSSISLCPAYNREGLIAAGSYCFSMGDSANLTGVDDRGYALSETNSSGGTIRFSASVLQ
jgi:hypothetical protein